MKQNILKLINDYKYEYRRTMGKDIDVTYHAGYFSIAGAKGVKAHVVQSQINEMMSDETATEHMENVNGVPTLIKAHEHVVTNIQSQKQCVEDRDLPWSCSVASEAYHCM